jgi:hypothetical protein
MKIEIYYGGRRCGKSTMMKNLGELYLAVGLTVIPIGKSGPIIPLEWYEKFHENRSPR